MTESPTLVGKEKEKIERSAFLLVYSPKDSQEIASSVKDDLSKEGFVVIDINDSIKGSVLEEDVDRTMDNCPAVLIIPSVAMKEDGPVKDALYKAITLKVEKKKRVVPIFFQGNEDVSVSTLSTMAGINWDGKTYGISNIDKDRAITHLRSFLVDNVKH